MSDCHHLSNYAGNYCPECASARLCYCPSDCNCRHQGAPWNRFSYCGCKAHAQDVQPRPEYARDVFNHERTLGEYADDSPALYLGPDLSDYNRHGPR